MPKKKDLRSVKPVSRRYIIKSQLRQYYRQEYEKFGRLNETLILSGDGRDAQCLTCEEFCEKKFGQFPAIAKDIANGILDVINFAATTTEAVEKRTKIHPSYSIWIEFWVKVSDIETTEDLTNEAVIHSHTEIDLSITIDNSRWLLHQNIRDLLISLAAALRPLPKAGLALSEASSQEPGSVNQIALLPLESVAQEACWHPLFPRKVIVRENLSREKGFFGLEISFDLMIALCGIDTAMLEQGGICLEGVFTSLVPIRCQEHYRVQWHLFCVDECKRESSEFRRDLWDVKMPRSWYKTDSLEILRGDERTSHYIGWCGSCEITLGTLTQNGRNVKESKAAVRKTEKIHASTSFTANASIHGVGVGLIKSVTRTSPARSPFEDRERSFTHWFVRSVSEQVILYSPSKQQAWMVSKTSLLLQLVRDHINSISQADCTLKFNLPDCTNRSATSSNAYYLLKEHLSAELPVLGAQRPFTVENLLLMFLHLLDKLSRRRIQSSWSQKFCGFELADVINQPHEFLLKEADVSHIPIGSLGGWTKLLDKIPHVFFFEGLEDPILPIPRPKGSPAGTICCCDRMPTGKNFLAATLSSLRMLTQNFKYMKSGRLTSTTFWHCENPEHLFQGCNCEDTIPGKGRLQAIWPKNTAQPPTMRTLENHPDGAVIFAPGLGILDGIA